MGCAPPSFTISHGTNASPSSNILTKSHLLKSTVLLFRLFQVRIWNIVIHNCFLGVINFQTFVCNIWLREVAMFLYTIGRKIMVQSSVVPRFFSKFRDWPGKFLKFSYYALIFAHYKVKIKSWFCNA
jgi:hypothetical protein